MLQGVQAKIGELLRLRMRVYRDHPTLFTEFVEGQHLAFSYWLLAPSCSKLVILRRALFAPKNLCILHSFQTAMHRSFPLRCPQGQDDIFIEDIEHSSTSICSAELRLRLQGLLQRAFVHVAQLRNRC